MDRDVNLFKAGIGRAVISPEEPSSLQPTGMTRLRPTRGVLDDLTVEALAVSAGNDLAFVISGDLRRLEYEWISAVRKRVSEETGCDPAHILFSSIHNHCSNPIPGNDAPNGEEAARRAVARIVKGIGDACLTAHHNLRQAEMAAFEARLRETIGEVRRMRLGNGTVVQCWGSGPIVAPGMKLLGQAGPNPGTIDCLAFREPGAQRPFAILTSYPTHPHLYELPYFSGETAGGVKREVERRLPGLIHAYANGTGGNIDIHGVHPMPGDEEEAINWFQESCREVGRRFADAIESTLGQLPGEAYTGTVSMKHAYWAQFEEVRDPSGRMIMLNALVLNDLALVSIPGELFSEFGIWMHAHNPFKHLLLLGYNGSNQGYVATPQAFEQGGYETMRGPASSPGSEALPMVPGSPNVRARPETGQEICDRVISMLAGLHPESAREGEA